MKKIEAIVRRYKLNDVLEELNRHQIFRITVTQVMGCGNQKGRTQFFRGTEYTVNLHPRVKLEIMVKDSWVEEIIEAIIRVAKTGEIGDGKILIYNIEYACRIRSGEQGEKALN